ncbi:MAG: tandem-95 repeat protein [Thermoplasmatales archaeon]|nr:tandem-95 repeat protein [Thermoplasmatales archaeon]
MKKDTRKGLIFFLSFILLFSSLPTLAQVPHVGSGEIATKEVYVYDSEENPIEDAYVEIYNEDYSYHVGDWTDENGYASFTMPPGEYTIKVDDIYSDSSYVVYKETFTIEAGQTLPNNVVVEIATKEVYVYDSEGNPIEDAYVEIYNEDYSYHVGDWTDENGYASFTMPPGEYTIKVDDIYSDSSYVVYKETFTIEAGQTLPNNVVVEIATKEVYVYDSEGNPIEDAYVEIYNEDYSYHVGDWTDENGYASFTMPPGEYTIEVEKEGYPSHSENFTIKAGEILVNEIHLGLIINTPPVAVDDSYETDEDTTLTIDASTGVLANDYDADEDTLTAVLVDAPAHGTLTLNPDGSFTYTPDADYNGEDTFTYQAYDGQDYSNIATVTITINPVNEAPVAVDDEVKTPQNFPVLINVTENDYDTDGSINLASIEITQAPAHGSVSVNADGTVLYTPDAGFTGIDEFKYKVKDNEGAWSNEATVRVEVYIPKMSISPSFQAVEKGEEFTVDIVVEAENIYAVECFIEFNSTLLEAIKVENGDMFESLNSSGIINNTAGRIDNIMGFTFLDQPASGGVFATITFKAKEAGNASINFDPETENGEPLCMVVDVENHPYPLVFENATVEIRNPPVYLLIEPAYQITKDKATFNISLNPNGNEISAIGFEIIFDPDNFSVTNVIDGGLFNFIYPIINNTKGSVIVSVTQLPPAPPVTEEGLLATIEFEAKQTGISEINIINVDTYPPLYVITQNATLEADLTPPETTLTFGLPYYFDGTNHWITSATQITLTAVDIGVGVEAIYYSFDGATWIEYTSPFTIDDEGTHTIEYYAVDYLGNEEEIKSIEVKVDNSEPTITKEFEGAIYNEHITSQTTIYLNSTDTGLCAVGSVHLNVKVYNASTGQLIYDEWNNVTSGTATLSFTIDEECTHWINITSIDDLGNTAWHNQTVYVDNTPPETTHLQGTIGDNNWYKSNVILNLTATDEKSGVNKIYYKIDAGAWNEYTSNVTISSEGQHTIYYYSIDNLGNTEAEKNISIKIDKTAPTASHSLAGTLVDGKYTTDVTISFSASDTVSGVSRIIYKIDGTSYTISDSYGSHTVSSEGSHTVEYYAVDNAGNTGSINSFSFTIQKNKPPVANFTYSPLQPYDTDTITFADRSYDPDGSIVNWTWDFGDGNISYAQNPTHKYADNGTYVVKLTVKDDKGANASTSQIIEVRNKPPTALITYSPDKPKPKEDINFTSLSTDEDGSIVNWTWNFGDGNISYEQNPKHAYEKEGTYNVTLIVKDNDGATAEKVIQIEIKAEKVNIWLYLIIIVILIIIAIAVFAIWRRRSKGEKKETEEKKEEKKPKK